MTRLLFYICLLTSVLAMACQMSDQKRILGRWQNESDWFEFKQDLTYNSGKDQLTMVSGFTYTIDPDNKELVLYTRDPKTTFYLVYDLKNQDTLFVRNAMSTNKTLIPFVRVKSNN